MNNNELLRKFYEETIVELDSSLPPFDSLSDDQKNGLKSSYSYACFALRELAADAASEWVMAVKRLKDGVLNLFR